MTPAPRAHVVLVLLGCAAGGKDLVTANAAANVMADVKWAASQSQTHIAPPPPPVSAAMQTDKILRTFRHQQAQLTNSRDKSVPYPTNDASFIKDDTATHLSKYATTDHSVDAHPAKPLWRTIVASHNVPVASLRSKSKMLLKHMKEVEKITGARSMNNLRSFKSHYLKELHKLHQTAVSGKAKAPARAPSAPSADGPLGVKRDKERALKKQMRDTMHKRMVKVARFVGETSASKDGPSAASTSTTDGSTAQASVAKSSNYLKKVDKHMSLAGKRLLKEMKIAKNEVEHTDHGDGLENDQSASANAPAAAAVPAPRGPVGFIASHTFDPKTDPEVQWQLAGHGLPGEEEAEGEGEAEVDATQPDDDALAKLKVGQVRHMVDMIGEKTDV